MASVTNNTVSDPHSVPTPLPYARVQPNLAGIVLAAGRASRFGSDKRLARFDQQHTLLSKSINLIHKHCSHVVVVVRPGDADPGIVGSYQGDPAVEQFTASDALHGMGASLANGIGRVIEYEEQQVQPFAGVLVMLADMPYIREQTVAQLVDGFINDKIAIPCYLQAHKEKKWGNPVVFGHKWFAALQGLRGDRGAKSLIKANPCARVEVIVDDLGILRDIDTPEDLPK